MYSKVSSFPPSFLLARFPCSWTLKHYEVSYLLQKQLNTVPQDTQDPQLQQPARKRYIVLSVL